MSYHIVKHIKVIDTPDKKEVWVNGADNNVYPRTPRYWHCESFSRLLKEKGRAELDVEILKEFECGNFQSSNKSRYTRALKMLYNMPVYDKFDWRCGMGAETEIWENKCVQEVCAYALNGSAHYCQRYGNHNID